MHSAVPLALISLLLPLTFAKDIPITVGADAKLAFNPSIVTAAVGDTLTFSYFPKNHSVGQSSFTDPCHPLAGGFFSGFQPLAAGPGPVEFVVPVNDTKPIWVYCAQTKGSHCQMGMSMVVNEPAPPSPNTLDAYKLAAAKTGNSTAPPNIAGGHFISVNSTSATGHNSTASGTASGGVASSTSSSSSASGSSSGSGSGSSSGGSNSGSSSGSFSSGGSTTEGSSSTSPSSVSFQGAAVKFASGLVVNLAAPGIVACALI